MRNNIRDQDLSTRYAHCPWDVFAVWLFQRTEDVCRFMQICIHIHIHTHILEIMSSHQYFQFQLVSSGFFLAFPHSIIVYPFWLSENSGPQKPQCIYSFFPLYILSKIVSELLCPRHYQKDPIWNSTEFVYNFPFSSALPKTENIQLNTVFILHSFFSSPSLYLLVFIRNTIEGLPWWRSGYESTCQCRGHGFDP